VTGERTEGGEDIKSHWGEKKCQTNRVSRNKSGVKKKMEVIDLRGHRKKKGSWEGGGAKISD